MKTLRESLRLPRCLRIQHLLINLVRVAPLVRREDEEKKVDKEKQDETYRVRVAFTEDSVMSMTPGSIRTIDCDQDEQSEVEEAVTKKDHSVTSEHRLGNVVPAAVHVEVNLVNLGGVRQNQDGKHGGNGRLVEGIFYHKDVDDTIEDQ